MAKPLDGCAQRSPLESVAKAIHECFERFRHATRELGVQLDDPERCRQQLLEAIGGVITIARVKTVSESQNIRDKEAQMKDLVNSVAEVIRHFFDPIGLLSVIHRRGRRAKFWDRDQKILALRRDGLTLGQIARRLRADGLLTSENRANDAQTVRAALTRAEKREQRERAAAIEKEARPKLSLYWRVLMESLVVGFGFSEGSMLPANETHHEHARKACQGSAGDGSTGRGLKNTSLVCRCAANHYRADLPPKSAHWLMRNS